MAADRLLPELSRRTPLTHVYYTTHYAFISHTELFFNDRDLFRRPRNTPCTTTAHTFIPCSISLPTETYLYQKFMTPVILCLVYDSASICYRNYPFPLAMAEPGPL
jgi:hypothetical protein